MSELVFAPFDEPWPDGGDVVELAIANPEYAAQLAAHRAVLERNPLAQSVACETFPPGFCAEPGSLVGGDELCIASTQLTLVVGYPFRGQYAVTVKPGRRDGFTRADLFRQLVRV